MTYSGHSSHASEDDPGTKHRGQGDQPGWWQTREQFSSSEPSWQSRSPSQRDSLGMHPFPSWQGTEDRVQRRGAEETVGTVSISPGSRANHVTSASQSRRGQHGHVPTVPSLGHSHQGWGSTWVLPHRSQWKQAMYVHLGKQATRTLIYWLWICSCSFLLSKLPDSLLHLRNRKQTVTVFYITSCQSQTAQRVMA